MQPASRVRDISERDNVTEIDLCLLINAPVKRVTSIFEQYFGLTTHHSCPIEKYRELECGAYQEIKRRNEVRKNRPTKTFSPILWPVPIWKNKNSQWVMMILPRDVEDVSFAISILLNTNTILFRESKWSCFHELKVFGNNKIIEHYIFGSECGILNLSSWDISVEFPTHPNLPGWFYQHCFKSSIRNINQKQIVSSLLDDRRKGFLQKCLNYYNAYIPAYEETPYFKPDRQNTYCLEQMDVIMLPSDWGYYDRGTPSYVI